MKKIRLFHLIALLSTLVFVALQWVDPALIREEIEGKTYDLRVRLRDAFRTSPPPDNIVIVSVDEKSIASLGRWPWDRAIMARLVGGIAAGMPRVLGVDILFSERDGKEADERLAQALRKAGNTVLAAGFIVPKGVKEIVSPKETPDALFDASFMEVRAVPGIPWRKFSLKAESAIPPLPEFAAVASVGHVYTLPDLDGVLRWEYFYVTLGNDCYPSFALQVARLARGVPAKDMVLYGGSAVRIGGVVFPTDISGRALINYLGEERTFPYFSAADVLDGKIHPDSFRGKIVLLGTSAIATYDQKVSPLSANLPGVEKNANVVANLLGNDFFRKSPGVLELMVILLTGGGLGILLPRFKAAGSVVLAGGAVAAYLAAACVLLVREGIWLNVVYPMTNILSIVTAHTVTSLFAEERRAREIRRIFSSYVSPKIVEHLIDRPELARLGGQRREVTLLFSDLRGFTAFSEKRQPEDVVSMLNEYFHAMTDVVFHWDGTLDKFIGDAIMAFWGAPLDQPDHAERAMRCALHMSDRLEMLRRKWSAEGKELMDCGIGINTGSVVIGNIGAEGRKMDYTAIGDHVNLAARVQDLTKKFDSRIMLTEFTRAKIQSILDREGFGHFELERAETVLVKGKEVPVEVFRLKAIARHGKSPGVPEP